MLRKCIKKIDSIIQWTKKWHFFHVLFICPYILLSLIFIYAYSRDYSTSSSVSYPNSVPPTTIYPDTPDFIATVVIFLIIACIHLSLMAAPIVEVLAVVIKAILRRKLCVEWNFLLNNKLYNIIYVLSILLLFMFIIVLSLPFVITALARFVSALPWVS